MKILYDTLDQWERTLVFLAQREFEEYGVLLSDTCMQLAACSLDANTLENQFAHNNFIHPLEEIK